MNSLKTVVLLAFMAALVWTVGYLFLGDYGFWLGMGLAALISFGSYFFSDRIALASMHAVPYDEHTMPEHSRIYHTLALVAKKENLPVPRLHIIDSPLPNAFATGRSPKKAAVAVTTGLAEVLSPDEMEGVIAHELSHVRNRDILISSVAAMLAAALSIFARIAFFGGLGRRRDNNPAMLIISIIAIILAPLAAIIIRYAISRSREFQADASGAEMTGQPFQLASALEKIDNVSRTRFGGTKGPTTNQAFASLFIYDPMISAASDSAEEEDGEGKSGGFFKRLFSSHPPTEERIRRLNDMTSNNLFY